MSTTKFELSSLPSTYKGSLLGLKLWQRWTENTNQTGRNLLNPQSGPAHNGTPQAFVNDTVNFNQILPSQDGAKILNNVFVSPVIASGTKIENLYSGQFQARAQMGGSFATQGYLTVMGHTGQLIAVLGEIVGSSLYPVSPLTNKSIPQNYVDASYTFNTTGQRLVLEVGAKNYNVGSGDYSVTQRFGYPNASGDLPVNQTDTSEKTPWISFSDTINFV